MRFLLSAIAIAFSSFALSPLLAGPENWTSAEEYEERCRSGDREACWIVGRWYKGGIQAPLDRAKARTFLKRSCDLGSSKGCDQLRGLDREEALASPSTSMNFLDSDCRSGAAGAGDSCLALAQVYAEGGGAAGKDSVKVRAYASLACQAEKQQGCFGLATMAAQGDGGPVDEKAAIDASEKACSLLLAEGCRLAVHLAAGKMAPPDGQRAAKAAEAGCKLNDSTSCMMLAKLYHEGQLLPGDAEKAMVWTHRACKLGAAEGCLALTRLAQTKAQAALGFDGLCKLRNADACVEFGKFMQGHNGFAALLAYKTALQVDPNHAEARRLHDQLAKQPVK